MAVAEPVTMGDASVLQFASRYTVASAGQVMDGVSGALLSVMVMFWSQLIVVTFMQWSVTVMVHVRTKV